MAIVIIGILLLLVSWPIAAAVLTAFTKLFKIPSAKYKNSLIVVLFWALAGMVAKVTFSILHLDALSGLLVTIITFIAFHYLLKHFYKNGWGKSLGIYITYSIVTVIILFVLIIPIRTFVVEPFIAAGESMAPGIHADNYLLVNKTVGEFKRNDVVVFRSPSKPDQIEIKRIIGLPGEQVQIINGKVLINNQTLSEPYVQGETLGSPDAITLKADEYFVLGDNRSKSADSRIFGPINKSNVIGKVFYNAK